MINLVRTAEPQQLVNNKGKQLAAFLASTRDRPHSYQYSGEQIRNELCSISFYKCYYCERKLSGDWKEIDHYIEIACDRTKALDWNNLYLSCDSCNDKIPHNIIPVTDALNPFIHSNEEIEEHLIFERENIRPKNGSLLGANTIKKFRLNSETLELWRSRFLTKFFDEYTDIEKKCKAEGNRSRTANENDNILKYTYPDHPFSLMFKTILKKKGLL